MKLSINAMKACVFFAVGGLGLLLAGCATSNRAMVLDGVGPDPTAPVNTRAAMGSLLVYSAYEVNANFNSRDSRRPFYSDYRILNPDGQLQQAVVNDSGTVLQRPKLVELPAGTYHVIAQANGYGFVIVPVTIVGGQTTLVHLQGGVPWPGHPAFTESNAVRLPDGQIVGWKSVIMK
jgi:hypothetical protein